MATPTKTRHSCGFERHLHPGRYGATPMRNPVLMRHKRLKLFYKATYGGALIRVELDP
jgi:hypothetical protein